MAAAAALTFTDSQLALARVVSIAEAAVTGLARLNQVPSLMRGVRSLIGRTVREARMNLGRRATKTSWERRLRVASPPSNLIYVYLWGFGLVLVYLDSAVFILLILFSIAFLPVTLLGSEGLVPLTQFPGPSSVLLLHHLHQEGERGDPVRALIYLLLPVFAQQVWQFAV